MNVFKTWFDGPAFLLSTECDWPEQPINNNYDAVIASLYLSKVEKFDLLPDPFLAISIIIQRLNILSALAVTLFGLQNLFVIKVNFQKKFIIYFLKPCYDRRNEFC